MEGGVIHSVNYIVAFYIGENRGYSRYRKKFQEDPLFFVKKHIDFLGFCRSSEINLVSFVFNDDIPHHLKNELCNLTLPNGIPIEIVFRENSGFSYGVWNDTIKRNIDKSEYFFLIEDDYIPSICDFTSRFGSFITDETPYICGLVETATPETAPHITAKGITDFASISNGIIQGKACKEILKKYGDVFMVNPVNDYPSGGWDNQVCFYKHFFDEGYKVGDILSEYSSPFMKSDINKTVIYGDPNRFSILWPIVIYE